jgi:very-short-patch-repair endonuclease
MTIDTPRYVVGLARQNRRNPTPTEKELWEYLRKRKLGGYKIRRQHPLGRYIADFYCAQVKVIFEIDGKIHDEIDVKEYDEIRQREIESRGLRVVRIRNEAVIDDLEKTFRD